jgi:hypothetical protein
MRKVLLITIGLFIVNILFFWLHRVMFQSSLPFLVIITILLHLVFLIYLPYEKIYKKEE